MWIKMRRRGSVFPLVIVSVIGGRDLRSRTEKNLTEDEEGNEHLGRWMRMLP